ncbi:MAG: glutathione S-transferase [Undibacterium sp.]|uniref:glutathione S-transferase family protein n=1 Tax=Undibacterium sp. TaxID=1914977 RepID=UPI0027233848|nr:glutathione S-transferase [Undibacterium sp.]MDO8652961.1 glutathione S-transferase [Undibacterium sp.]
MIKLCGFAVSNYYNKIKLALMEKNIAFEEELVWADRAPELLQLSPLGKIPYIETEQGSLCESQVILEYIEAKYPAHPLLPVDPYAAGKNRELITFLELHLELVARELYAEAFFGGSVTDEVKKKVEKLLTRNINAFSTMVKFSPYIAGAEFTLADCAAVVHFPLISMLTKIIYGRDFLADLPVKQYIKMMSERPAMLKINADRKANQELMASRKKAS